MVHLRIDNQKNGQCSQIIATMLSQSLAAQLKHVLHGFLHFSMIMPHLTLSYVLTDHTLGHNSCMLPMMISCAIQASIPHLQHCLKGYKPKIVGTHSLRSSGAIALFLSSSSPKAIMKMGCWTNTMFMTYIHEQVDTLNQDAAAKMSLDVSFANLDVLPPSP